MQEDSEVCAPAGSGTSSPEGAVPYHMFPNGLPDDVTVVMFWTTVPA